MYSDWRWIRYILMRAIRIEWDLATLNIEEGGRKSWSSDKVLLWTALYWDSCRTSCIQIPKKTKQIWYQRKLLRELTRENY